jgi:hypothetical protein
MRQMQLMDADVGWILDKKNSIARLEIIPGLCDGKVLFRYSIAIEIKPYPNPFMFGGEWSSGSKETEAEVEQLIADFRKRVTAWEKRGIKVEVVRRPESRRRVYPAQMRLG